MSAGGKTIAIIGLGYVGLPLAIAFGMRYRTLGYDCSSSRIDNLRRGVDPAGGISAEELRAAVRLELTTDPALLAVADFIIIAVPTPVDVARNPDLGHLINASETVGRHMKAGATVIFESTVYPGATEEVCIPVLERASGMRWAASPLLLVDEGREERAVFYVGYSPERINPGDREHTLVNVIKVVAGDTPETLDRIASLYGEVVEAGIHRVSSIMVAEAAKIIENTQRDLNIALMNELAIIFGNLGIDTTEVLDAAGTKWNFLRFRPGLVGGHCIGVDPYYLTYKAEMLGYHPQVILAGRRINDGMGKYIAEKTIKLMAQSGRPLAGARAVVLGLTFKENCPDLRNSRVPDIVRELQSFGIEVVVHDPIANAEEAMHEHSIHLLPWDALPQCDALIIAVAHEAYRAMGASDIASKLAAGGCIVDVKAIFELGAFKTIKVWRL
jgi:nucleotide sugar dehydrogenase